MRALAVDFGSVRIGIAVGVDAPLATTPRNAIAPLGSLAKDAAQLAAIAKREAVDVVVVGVPENEADPRMARICRTLSQNLRDLGVTVAEVDESLSSVAAETRLLATGDLTAAQRRKRRDGEAACILLERFFAEKA